MADAAARYGYERWTTDWRDIVADPTDRPLRQRRPELAHAEPSIAAAEAGKHVLCEKPLGRTADEAYTIWSRVAARRRQAPLRLQLPVRAGGEARA